VHELAELGIGLLVFMVLLGAEERRGWQDEEEGEGEAEERVLHGENEARTVGENGRMARKSCNVRQT